MASTSLQVGDKAPDFVREGAGGEPVQLSGFQGRQHVVLYFYPADHTKICTAQACEFRDRHADFAAAGAVVIGVSPNSLESHREFAAAQKLPFHLLSDADGSLRKLYAIPNRLWLVPQRATFVIDKRGIIQMVYVALFQGPAHADRALHALGQLRSHEFSPIIASQSVKTPLR
jgi:thioredoxin-dependent peroxiredoxin